MIGWVDVGRGTHNSSCSNILPICISPYSKRNWPQRAPWRHGERAMFEISRMQFNTNMHSPDSFGGFHKFGSFWVVHQMSD